MTLKKRFLTFLTTLTLVVSLLPVLPVMADTDPSTENDIYILYTNDVHCEVSGYPALAAYRAQLIQDGKNVVTVDAGDAIQGEIIGTQTKGAAIIDIMNTVGYDYAVPGNHEFDYSMSDFLNLTKDANFTYLSANFMDLTTNSLVLTPYDIQNINGERIAFIGICTPETYTKSTPAFFQDENGHFIYSFSENTFYDTIQNTIDQVKAEGADLVVAVGHLGVDGITDGWSSPEVIANTVGIDAFIDAHSHEIIPDTFYPNKAGQDVPLTSTGSQFKNFGVMTLSVNENGTPTITTRLVQPSDVDRNSSDAATNAYQAVQTKIDDYNAQLDYLYEEIGTSEVTLSDSDENGNWCIRQKETNLGDYIADAYRTICQADIALVNSGGIRTSVQAGKITRKAFMDVNPWDNAMCVIEASGQQILDALEHGTRNLPETCGGFLHVSGLTYEVDQWKESPVATDDQGMFQSIDNTKERRVCNVKVNGQALDPDKTYTVCGNAYMLQSAGDGFTMFKGNKVVAEEGLPTDASMLIAYFTDTLKGQISASQYGNILGDGRITIYTDASQKPVDDNKKDPGQETETPNTKETESETKAKESESETKTPAASDKNNKNNTTAKKAVKTGDEAPVGAWTLTAIAAASMIIIISVKNKKKVD